MLYLLYSSLYRLEGIKMHIGTKDHLQPTVKIFSIEKNALIEVQKILKSDEEWKSILDPLSYRVTRKKGTEQPFCGPLNFEKRQGIFRCICCGNDLFISATKFNSQSGWPSFIAPVHDNNVYYKEDKSFMMTRTEVLCAVCDAHLGHVFDDGPPPTGRRFCMNSASMTFMPFTPAPNTQKKR